MSHENSWNHYVMKIEHLRYHLVIDLTGKYDHEMLLQVHYIEIMHNT